MNQITRKQHTIPKCYLKSFGTKLWVYDKNSKKWWIESIGSLSVIPWNYEHPSKKINETEDYLGKIENIWSKEIRDKIIDPPIVKGYCLSTKEKEIFSEFIWTLMIRVPEKIQAEKQSIESLKNVLKDIGADQKVIDEYSNIDIKKFNLDLIKKSNPPVNIKSFEKDYYWLFFKNNNSMHKFFLSDNPVIEHSGKTVSHYKFIPLSPDLYLHLILKTSENSHLEKKNGLIEIANFGMIKAMNILQMQSSYKYLYASNKRQKKFIDHIIKEEPRLGSINQKRRSISYNNKEY